jgi:hypothetical protein
MLMNKIKPMIKTSNIGFEVLTVVAMKSTIFWDITTRSPLKVNQRRLTSGGLHGVISQKTVLFKMLQITRTLSAETLLAEGRTSKNLCALKFLSMPLK